MSHFPKEVTTVLERYAAIWVNDATTRERQMNPADRLAYHQEHSLPVIEDLQSWCEAALEEERVEENSGLGRALRYYLNHYEGLMAFCRIEGAQAGQSIWRKC
jgi:transposase